MVRSVDSEGVFYRCICHTDRDMTTVELVLDNLEEFVAYPCTVL